MAIAAKEESDRNRRPSRARVRRTISAVPRRGQSRRRCGTPEARIPSPRGNFAAIGPYSSQNLPREQREGLFDAFSRLCAGSQNAPPLRGQLRFQRGIKLPVPDQIALVDDEDERDYADFLAHFFLQ